MLSEQLLLVTLGIGLLVSLLFLLSIIMRRNDIADIAWGGGIFLVALISFATGPHTTITTLITILAGLWGLRLALRIFLRNIKKPEDFRYKAWRDEWGKWFYVRSFFQVYLLQGLLMIVIGYPFIHAAVYGAITPLGVLGMFGVAVWCIGYFFEVVGDYQLDQFIKKPANKGEVMDLGLWQYTRHPNYFGEVTMWWGVWLITLTLPFGIFTIISPLTITFLILKVSGVPMLEKKFAGDPKYEAYKKRTSVFFPLPQK
jgi:steroid 5-alpha reductase family enzyme